MNGRTRMDRETPAARRRTAMRNQVIEIPTPRWTAYDTKFYGETLAVDVRAVIRDRAYTSPIWYRP